MKIDVLASDGSPLGVNLLTLWGTPERVGVGGAEYAILTLCEEWHKAGHEVTFYNNAESCIFEHRGIGQFDPQNDRDVLIILRSPNRLACGAKGKHVWFSMDQYTIGDFKEFADSGCVDQIVCISPNHARYFNNRYGISDTTVIDLPVRVDDFPDIDHVRHDSLIFTSIPDRGLMQLHDAWKFIKQEVPTAMLTITSDYRLWGNVSASNDRHVQSWFGDQDVHFLGAVPRKHLLNQLAMTEILAFPNIYDELFCLAVAEASCMGVYPITSSVGALETTNMGKIVEGPPEVPAYARVFADAVIAHLRDDELSNKREELRKKALKRFSPETVLQQWNELVFHDV